MRLIYLANPYHSPDKSVMDARHKSLMTALAACANTTENLVFYSPIAHWHETAKHHDLPTDFHWWRERDFYMLRKSAAMWILPLEGWKESFGVSQEIEFAVDLSIPVFYILDLAPSVVISDVAPSRPIPLTQ